MDDDWPALMARLTHDRLRAQMLLTRLEGMRGFYRRWVWMHRAFMVCDVFFFGVNVRNLQAGVNDLTAAFLCGVNALLVLTFLYGWQSSVSRWREYQTELTETKEFLQWLDESIDKIRGMYAR